MPHFRNFHGTSFDFNTTTPLLRGTRSVPAEELALNYEEIKVTY